MAGTAAPAGTLTNGAVRMLVGGLDADVDAAGLKAGATGVYEVRVKVPAGRVGGSLAPMVASVGERSSEEVGLPVK